MFCNMFAQICLTTHLNGNWGKHFRGTTRGNCIGPIQVPPKNEVWNLTVAQKKQYYGTAGKVLVGGAAESGSEAADAIERKRAPTDCEPVAFHGTSFEFWEEQVLFAGPAKVAWLPFKHFRMLIWQKLFFRISYKTCWAEDLL